MSPPNPPRHALVALALAVLAAAPALAQIELHADEPPVEPSVEGLSAELVKVQHSLQNARIKFERGIKAGPGAPADRPETPMFACCGSNLEQIDRSLRRALVHIDGLARRADASGDEIALGQLELIHDGVMGLGQGLQALASTEDRRRTAAALAGMIRPFTLATGAVRGLSTCCAERLSPEASSAVQ